MTTAPSRAGALAPAGIGLTLFVVTVQTRMDDPWADGVLFLAAVVPALVVLGLGLAAARGDERSSAAATALLVAGLVLAGIAIARLGQLLAGGDYTGGGGTLTWMLALFTAVAAYCTARARSSACLLISSLAAVALLLEAVNWIFDTENVDTFRALLAVSFAVLFVAGLAVSGRTGTILVGAAGVSVVASSYALGFVFIFSPEAGQLGWGWELINLVEGLALAAYAAAELAPGPGYLAFFVLLTFALIAATGAGGVIIGTEGQEHSNSLVGWPLTLGIGTALVTAWGLRRPSSG
jgi:hypothetical protein